MTSPFKSLRASKNSGPEEVSKKEQLYAECHITQTGDSGIEKTIEKGERESFHGSSARFQESGPVERGAIPVEGVK